VGSTSLPGNVQIRPTDQAYPGPTIKPVGRLKDGPKPSYEKASDAVGGWSENKFIKRRQALNKILETIKPEIYNGFLQQQKKWRFTFQEVMSLPSNNGHYLVLDDKEAPIGWIDMDHAAFFPKKWKRKAKASKKFFTSGLATFNQGLWWNPKGTPKFMLEGLTGPKMYQDAVIVYDFERMIEFVMPSSQDIPVEYPYYQNGFELVKLRKAVFRWESVLSNSTVSIDLFGMTEDGRCVGGGQIVWSPGTAELTQGNQSIRGTLEDILKKN
jgi:hypothetical protein